MKKIILFIILILSSGSICSQIPRAKIYLSNGNIKYFNLSDIQNLSFTKNQSHGIVKIYLHNSDTITQLISDLDSIKFENSQSIYTNLLLYIPSSSSPKNYQLNDIDSINFYIPAPLKPEITKIYPTSGNIGDSIMVYGKNFGDEQGLSFVSFDNHPAISYRGWSSTAIKAIIPDNANSGKLFVKINGVKSNAVKFTLKIDNIEVVKIDSQYWMIKNLEVDRYRNGDTIPQDTSIFPEVWMGLKTGAWCHYKYDSAMGKKYGKLYNWYAVNDPRGLAPAGWHIPSEEEWSKLETYLGGKNVAGGILKETGTIHWSSPNEGATDSIQFCALPGGYRYLKGTFLFNSYYGAWWTSTVSSPAGIWTRYISNTGIEIFKGNDYRSSGFSVRCIKDD